MILVPSALPHISHVTIPWQSKSWPHIKMASCGTLSKHPQCSHISHTMSTKLKCLSLCLKSRYHFLFTTRNSDQANQPCTHQRQKYYLYKNKESCTDILHQQIAFTYLLQPYSTIPPVQRTWKEFWGRTTSKRKQQQQELWLHWYVNSPMRLMFNYLLWSVIPPF